MRNIHFSPKEGGGSGGKPGEKPVLPKGPLETLPCARSPEIRTLNTDSSRVVLSEVGISTPCGRIIQLGDSHMIVSNLMGDHEEIVLMVSKGKIKGPDGKEDDDLEMFRLDAPLNWDADHIIRLAKEGDKIVGFRLERYSVVPEVTLEHVSVYGAQISIVGPGGESSVHAEKGRVVELPGGMTMILTDVQPAIGEFGRTYEIKFDIEGDNLTGWTLKPKED